MLYAAEYLNKGLECLAYGFEEAEEKPVPTADEPVECDGLVLPLPLSGDGRTVNAPYHRGELPLEVLKVREDGYVFAGGTMPALEEFCQKRRLKLKNYLKREELLVMNAVPTAEGALEIMLRELPVTIWGLNVLITGFGRVGEAMARTLTALGAHVTVCARRPEQLARARGMHCAADSFDDGFRRQLPLCDVIVNTVPAPLFDKSSLKLLKRDCLIVDLASVSCIGDMSMAEGIKLIWALSLPGKTAPVTAGRIIGQTVENMLWEEEQGCGTERS